MDNIIHIDDKWFFLTVIKTKNYLAGKNRDKGFLETKPVNVDGPEFERMMIETVIPAV
jgi:hypothetical protein